MITKVKTIVNRIFQKSKVLSAAKPILSIVLSVMIVCVGDRQKKQKTGPKKLCFDLMSKLFALN